MSKILVTGGAGFIGTHLANKFVELGHSVAIVDNFSNTIAENTNRLHKKIRVYKSDITDNDLLKIFQKEKFDYVSHHAAQIRVQDSIEKPDNDAKQNILGTINVLACSQKTHVKKVVFASSGGALYGNAKQIPTSEEYPTFPQSPYGISKLSCEHYFRYFYEQYGLSYTILRYANVYGAGQRSDAEGGVISIFLNALRSGGKITIYGKGTQTRDFIYIKDIIAINEKAMFSKKNGIYNVGTSQQTSIQTLYKQLKKLDKRSVPVVYKSQRMGEVKKSALAIDNVSKEFAWKPQFSLFGGLYDMYQYYKKTL